MQFFVGAYWGSRPSDIGKDSVSIWNALEKIQGVDTRLAGWRRKGRSRSEAQNTPIVDSSDSIKKVMTQSLGQRLPEPDIGYRLDLWNGRSRNEEASLSITIGSIADPPLGNSFVIRLPKIENHLNLSNIDIFVNLAKIVIEIFDPDECTVTSHEMIEHISHHQSIKPFGVVSYQRNGLCIPKAIDKHIKGIEISEGREVFALQIGGVNEPSLSVISDTIMKLADGNRIRTI